MAIPLTDLDRGKTGKVLEISGGRGIRQKLDALGIRTGVKIKKISSQILRGPAIVQAGNTKVAIGYGMAGKIIVDVVHHEHK
ncbi:MAG: FeoA domain-containing protein [Elusimicrobia bacterium]|nr:FeoA domain-containing protein [Elusimicrobiota bacterium]